MGRIIPSAQVVLDRPKAYIGTAPPIHDGPHEWTCVNCDARLDDGNAPTKTNNAFQDGFMAGAKKAHKQASLFMAALAAFGLSGYALLLYALLKLAGAL